MSFPDFLKDVKGINLTYDEIYALNYEMSSPLWIDDLEKFSYGMYTSLSESSHSIVNIYLRKGKNYRMEAYKVLHSLAILHNHELMMKNQN